MELPFWESKWHDLCDKMDRDGYEALTSEEKVWINVRTIIDSTENGGLISYFYNSVADTFGDCLKALSILGAQDVRASVERVAALFPAGMPESVDARNDIINSWDDDSGTDELLEEIDDELMPRLPDLDAKLDEFVRTAGLAT